MKTQEKIYTALVLCLVGICIIVIATFQLLMIPKLDSPDSVRVFHFITVLFVLLAIAFGATSSINLKRHKLEMVPTVIQIVSLIMFGYGIPLAIWGIILLRKRQKECQQSPPPYGSPAVKFP